MVAKKKIRHNKIYFTNNHIEAFEMDHKSVCPWCKTEPREILYCHVENGNFTFFKKCQTCCAIIKIERKSS